MAESCDRAFGRYLKTLRERRKLSLDDVCSLSHTFPESIRKGYLSRCENGHQKPAFSKVIALSRIYEVPADVLVERMELDMELDRVGGPDTEGMSYADLLAAGRLALQQGYRWNGYGYLRDAAHRSPEESLLPEYGSIEEQSVVAFQNVATSANALGRHRYALHEFVHAEATGSLGPKLHALILERIASCHRSLNSLDAAEHYSELALTEANACGDRTWKGHLYNTRALIAFSKSDFASAAHYYHRSYRAYRLAEQRLECALILTNLSECYFNMQRYKAARRASEASLKLASSHNQQRVRALSLILLGEVLELEGDTSRAEKHWREATSIARDLNDRDLRFKAELALYKRALRRNEHAVARSIRRRLKKLSPWLPKETEELSEFHSLAKPAPVN